MSHHKERSAKNCLNCNAEVLGRYCQVCGQENIEPKETAWNLLTHFFKDVIHFDGKFFSTLKFLVSRPGFLSKEYMVGRRASYLNPVKMYVFTSAIFFLVFFTFSKITDNEIGNTTINGKTSTEIEKMDSLHFADFTREINREDKKPDVPMSRAEFKRYKDSAYENTGIRFTTKLYGSKAEYDSVLKSGKKNHNWLQRQLIYKQIEVNKKFNNNSKLILKSFVDTLLHSLPQMLFVSLPLFAVLLMLLYIRRKDLYYVDHLIFTVHFYIFSFIVMFVMYWISKLNGTLDWGFLKLLNFLIFLGMLFYEYKAMRKFYLQGRAKTILKFILLNFIFLIFLAIIFFMFIVFSFFKI